jgi:hypothetical protein
MIPGENLNRSYQASRKTFLNSASLRERTFPYITISGFQYPSWQKVNCNRTLPQSKLEACINSGSFCKQSARYLGASCFLVTHKYVFLMAAQFLLYVQSFSILTEQLFQIKWINITCYSIKGISYYCPICMFTTYALS